MARTGRSRRAAKPSRSVTIRDVAHRADVSTATVSRTLAAPHLVAEATRSLVYTAIRETGFTPNATARSLRARSTKMVLALLNGIGNSFYTSILNAIEEVLFEAGYGMIMGDTRADPRREAHYDELVRAGQVDGVLLFTGRLPGADFAALNATVPITLVCNDIPDIDSLPVVESANRDAARRMVEHLVGLGHRRIAHVTGPPHNVEARERLGGYRDALAAAGLPIDDGLIWEGAFAVDAGVIAARRFLAVSPRPTALFAASDDIAIGLIKTIRDTELSVPDDVSIAGFDDIDYAGVIDPPLTTMRQPRADLGRLAAENLLRRMAGGAGKPSPRRVRLSCELIIRQSVRAIAAAERAPRTLRAGAHRAGGLDTGVRRSRA
ncbi:MAG: LacI family DNA-binding transcriptional regulator [Bauldia sp.]